MKGQWTINQLKGFVGVKCLNCEVWMIPVGRGRRREYPYEDAFGVVWNQFKCERCGKIVTTREESIMENEK